MLRERWERDGPRWRQAFWALFALAALGRLLFAVEATRERIGIERHPLRDMTHYEHCADLIRAGDFALVGGLKDYDDLVVILGRERFHEWNGPEPLAQAPLYPYLIAACEGVTGSNYPLRWLQAALSLASAVLVWRLALLLTRSPPVAVLAFALYAFHPTTVCYTGFLLRATLFTFLCLTLILSLAHTAIRPRWRDALWLGLLLGVMHLCRKSLTLYLPSAVVVLLLTRGSWRERARDVALLLAAFLVSVSPLMVRNALHHTALLHNDPFGPISVMMGNLEASDGLRETWPTAEYAQGLLDERGPGLIPVLLGSIERFSSPGAWALLQVRKLHGFFSGYEPWNNVRYHDYEAVLSSLGCFPFKSVLILPFALLGILLGLRAPRRWWPLYLGLFTILVPCLVVVPTARFRLPAFPFLAIFAALALRRLRWAPRRERVVLLTGLVLSALVAYPVRPTHVPPHLAHDRMAGLHVAMGRPELARDQALAALRTHPWNASAAVGRPGTPAWEEFLELHRKAAGLCADLHDEEGAEVVRRSLVRALRAASPK